MWVIGRPPELVWLEKVCNNRVCGEWFVCVAGCAGMFIFFILGFLNFHSFYILALHICQVLVELVASLAENMREEKREELVYNVKGRLRKQHDHQKKKIAQTV